MYGAMVLIHQVDAEIFHLISDNFDLVVALDVKSEEGKTKLEDDRMI